MLIPPDPFTTRPVEQEWYERQNRRIRSLLGQAGFRLSVSAHNIDYSSQRKLDKNQFEQLLDLNFLQQGENVIFTGLAAWGKAILLQSIGVAASRRCPRSNIFQGQLHFFLASSSCLVKSKPRGSSFTILLYADIMVLSFLSRSGPGVVQSICSSQNHTYSSAFCRA